MEECCIKAPGKQLRKVWREGEEGISWNSEVMQQVDFCCALFALWRRGGSLWFFLKVGWWGGWGVVGTLARKLRSLGISSNHKAEKLPIVDMPPVAVSALIKSSLHVEERPLKMILKDGRAFDIFGCDFFRIPRIKLDCWVVRVRD